MQHHRLAALILSTVVAVVALATLRLDAEAGTRLAAGYMAFLAMVLRIDDGGSAQGRRRREREPSGVVRLDDGDESERDTMRPPAAFEALSSGVTVYTVAESLGLLAASMVV